MKSELEAPARMVYDVDRKALYSLIRSTTDTGWDGKPIESFDYGNFTGVLPDDTKYKNLEMLFVTTELYHGPELDGGDPTYDEDNEPAENGPLPSVAQWDQYEEACHKALLRTRVTHIWEYFLTYWKRLKDLRSVIYGLGQPGLCHSEAEYEALRALVSACRSLGLNWTQWDWLEGQIYRETVHRGRNYFFWHWKTFRTLRGLVCDYDVEAMDGARQAYMKACRSLDPVTMIEPSDLTARLTRLHSLLGGSTSEESFMTSNTPSPSSDSRHTYDPALTAYLHNRALERNTGTL